MTPPHEPTTTPARAPGQPEMAVGGPRGVRMLKPLASRDFSLLWAGMTISMIGDGIYYVALAFQVYGISNSPTALSVVGFAWTGSLMLFLLVGGVVADRFERRKIMLISDVVRALAIGAMGVLSIRGMLELSHLVALGVLYGAATAFFQPAFNAIVPDIVPSDQLVEANSLNQFVEPLTLRFLGPAIGGAIIGAVGTGVAFVLDGATFLASAACLAFMRPRTVASQDDRPSAVAEIAEGFRYVRSRPWLWGTFLSATIGLLAFYGPWEVLVPYVVKNELGGSASGYGIVVAAGGVGAIIAAVLMGQRGLPRRHMLALYLFWTVGVLSMAAYAVVTEIWQAMVVSFVLSACFAVGMIIWTTLMHVLVPQHLLGRVSSLDWLVSGGFIPLSFAITGPIAEAIGPDKTLIGAGVIGALATISFLLWPGMRDTETDGSVHTSPHKNVGIG